MQAVPGQFLHLVGAAAGVDEHFHRDPHVPASFGITVAAVAPAGLQQRQPFTQLVEYLAGQCAARAVVFDLAGNVAFAEGEVVGQPLQRLCGSGQAHFPDIAQEPRTSGR